MDSAGGLRGDAEFPILGMVRHDEIWFPGVGDDMRDCFMSGDLVVGFPGIG